MISVYRCKYNLMVEGVEKPRQFTWLKLLQTLRIAMKLKSSMKL